MKIDPNAPIAGVRPSMLKRLFRRHHEFTTDQFVNLTKADAATLKKLARLGWVKPDRGWWVTTEMGARLAGASLTPPIRVEQARNIVTQVIDAAIAVNDDPERFHVVERLVLFGSLLTAPADGVVGDIDVAYALDSRGGEDLQWAEEQRAPPSFFPRWAWPSEVVLRKLKAHRKVALHTVDELGHFKIEGHVVYERHQGRLKLPW